MARPLKEGMDYFPHDVDASDDEKIEAMRAVHGNDGYAFYFITLERIYRTPNGELDLSKPAFKAGLIRKIGVTAEKFDQMLETAFEVKCFCRQTYEERLILTSNGVQRRFSEVQSLREKWRSKHYQGSIQGVLPEENPGDKQEDNSAENGEVTGESINKSINKKHIKDPPYNPPKKVFGDHVLLTEEQHQKLIEKHGEEKTREMIEMLDSYLGESEKNQKRYTSHYDVLKKGGWVDREHRERHQNDRASPPKNNGMMVFEPWELDPEFKRQVREREERDAAERLAKIRARTERTAGPG